MPQTKRPEGFPAGRKFLAAVIRGNPPETLHAAMRETLTRIHEDLRIPLEEFDGDTTPLADLSTPLESCLQRRAQPQETGNSRADQWLGAASGGRTVECRKGRRNRGRREGRGQVRENAAFEHLRVAFLAAVAYALAAWWCT